MMQQHAATPLTHTLTISDAGAGGEATAPSALDRVALAVLAERWSGPFVRLAPCVYAFAAAPAEAPALRQAIAALSLELFGRMSSAAVIFRPVALSEGVADGAPAIQLSAIPASGGPADPTAALEAAVSALADARAAQADDQAALAARLERLETLLAGFMARIENRAAPAKERLIDLARQVAPQPDGVEDALAADTDASEAGQEVETDSETTIEALDHADACADADAEAEGGVESAAGDEADAFADALFADADADAEPDASDADEDALDAMGDADIGGGADPDADAAGDDAEGPEAAAEADQPAETADAPARPAVDAAALRASVAASIGLEEIGPHEPKRFARSARASEDLSVWSLKRSVEKLHAEMAAQRADLEAALQDAETAKAAAETPEASAAAEAWREMIAKASGEVEEQIEKLLSIAIAVSKQDPELSADPRG